MSMPPPPQPLYRLGQLPHLRGALPGPDRIGHAVLGMVVQQDQGHALQGRPDGVDLGQHVDAVAILVHHALQSADLALDPTQPSLDGLLVLRITWHGAYYIPLTGMRLAKGQRTGAS